MFRSTPVSVRMFCSALAYLSFTLFLSAQTDRKAGRLAVNMSDSRDRVAAEAEAMLDFIPEVVAVVNESPIAGSRVKSVLFPDLFSRFKRQASLPNEEELRKLVMRIIDQLVDRQLLLSACRQAGYEATLNEARKHMEKIAATLGEKRFEQALRQQRLSREEFLDQTAGTLALNEWLEGEIFPDIEVEEEEIKQFYRMNEKYIVGSETVEVSHILIAVSGDADRQRVEAARTKAEKLADKLAAGEGDFAALAEKYSDCPSRSGGGRLPAFARGQMVPEFERAAFATPAGEVSGPVRTGYGFHFILTHEHQEEKRLSYEEVKHELKRILMNQRINRKIEKILDQQREGASIEIIFQP